MVLIARRYGTVRRDVAVRGTLPAVPKEQGTSTGGCGMMRTGISKPKVWQIAHTGMLRRLWAVS